MTPFKGTNTITSPFGPRKSPITGQSEQHKGQDITTTGAWTVRECTGGSVLRVTSDRWRGNYVDVETAPGVFERYQHLDSVAVQPGQRLKQGDAIGVAGSTGQCTGRHLHFEVQKNGAAVDPSAWSGLPNRVGATPGNDELDAPAGATTGEKNTAGESPGECALCLASVEHKLDQALALLNALDARLAAAARALGENGEGQA